MHVGEDILRKMLCIVRGGMAKKHGVQLPVVLILKLDGERSATGDSVHEA
jgi:hypothetical protein